MNSFKLTCHTINCWVSTTQGVNRELKLVVLPALFIYQPSFSLLSNFSPFAKRGLQPISDFSCLLRQVSEINSKLYWPSLHDDIKRVIESHAQTLSWQRAEVTLSSKQKHTKRLLNKRLSGEFLMKGQQVLHQTDPLVHGQLHSRSRQGTPKETQMIRNSLRIKRRIVTVTQSVKCLLCSRHCSESFVLIVSLNPHNLVKWRYHCNDVMDKETGSYNH